MSAGRAVSKRCGQAGDVVLVGEEEGELIRQIGMRRFQISAIERVARLRRLEISRDDIVQPLLALGRAISTRLG